MNLENNKNYMDEKSVWKHNSKIIVQEEKNIRKNSLFEEFNIPLSILYFLTLYCIYRKIIY